MNDQPGRDDARDRNADATYIAELAANLAELARGHGLDAPAYILEMARLEAESAIRHLNARR